MKKPIDHRNGDGMRPEYDFAAMASGVRGKHYDEYRKGTNVVLLQPDVAEAFPTEDAVNEGLRADRDSGSRRDEEHSRGEALYKRIEGCAFREGYRACRGCHWNVA